jgi:hypothetical protein
MYASLTLQHDSSVIELLWTNCGNPELVKSVQQEEVAFKVPINLFVGIAPMVEIKPSIFNITPSI